MTMKKLIYKEQLPPTPDLVGFMLPGIRPRVIAVAPDTLDFWFEFEPPTPGDADASKLEVLTVWTGHEFDLPNDFRYVATTTVMGLVIHVYWREAL